MTTKARTLEVHTAAIIRAAKANPNITVASLQDELERGDIGGWMKIAQLWDMNFSQWSGAMERAIAVMSTSKEA
jgi:hypothetical protein